jgi:hypothetical protein
MNNLSVRLSSVEITAASVTEIDGKQVIVSLPRDQIVSLTMQKGIKSERPIVDIVIGAVLILMGVYIFLPMLSGLCSPSFLEPQNNLNSRYTPMHFVVMGLVPIPIGIYLIFNALQKRYFLQIYTTKGMKRKIVFNDDISYSEIRSFIEQAQSKYGYHIVTTMQEE